MRQLARRLGAGRALYMAYHKPRGFVERCRTYGVGPLYRAHRGRRAMEKAAASLPPPEVRPDGDPVTLHFLTGRMYWYQTLFCAYSFALRSRRPVRLNLQDDGTLCRHHIAALERLFPVRVETAAESQERLRGVLPESAYPTLIGHRRSYPYLRKILDMHAGFEEPRVVLDSDMLFFAEPAEILGWLENPGRWLLMTDRRTCYGYPAEVLSRLLGEPMPEKVNVGICALLPTQIDWRLLEDWTRELLEREGTSYYLEQALTVMLAVRASFGLLPQDRYLIAPSRADVEQRRGILHHYVSESKLPYFDAAWRLAIREEASR